MKSVLMLVLLVLVIVGVWAAANFGFEQTRAQTDTVYGAVRQIVVQSERGDVDLVPARRRIEVRQTRHWVLSRPKLEQTRRNGVLTLKSTCPAEAVVLKCYSDLRVAVPAGLHVMIQADSGDVDVRGTNLREVHAETDAGDIELDLRGLQEHVVAGSDSGDVDVVARFTRWTVDVQSDSGDVNVDVGGPPRRVVAGSNSGDVEVAVPRGAYRIRARSGSGDADVSGLRRNGRSLHSVHARTDSGDVTVRAR